MLDGGDKANGSPFRKGSAFSSTATSKSILIRFEDHLWLFINRRMPEMDKHISVRESIKRKIAGTITGIAAQDHFKTGIFQSGSHVADRRFSPSGNWRATRCAPFFFKCSIRSEVPFNHIHLVGHFDLYQ